MRRASLFARLIKVEHTVFALPFAYVGALLAANGVPSAHDLVWITVAMAGARSLAMALNRLIDVGIDAANPRTASRELPSGALSIASVVAFSLASLALFLVAVWQLAPIVRYLWPIPVVGFVVYPYLKRFTWLCHLWLGAVDGLAPVGGWVAVRGDLPWQAWALGGAVGAWVAGFDVFYSLFDIEVDRAQGLHSIAARFGESAAFAWARALHLIAVCLLVLVGLGIPVGWWYWAGVAAVGLLLAYEHSLVRPGDLKRLGRGLLHDERGDQRGLLRLRARRCHLQNAATVVLPVNRGYRGGGPRRPGDARVIRATNLGKRFGTKRIFDRLELGLDLGGFLLVTGPKRFREDHAPPRPRRSRRSHPGELQLPARAAIGYLGHEPLVYRELSPLESLDLFARLCAVEPRGARVGTLLRAVRALGGSE